MNYKLFTKATDLARILMNYHVKEGYRALDCTVGNGIDTVLLAELVGEDGIVYGFDIQDRAICKTKKQLQIKGLDRRVVLIKDGHEKINEYIYEGLDFIIYNLGYLPGGDKRIKTKAETSLLSLKKSLQLLNNNGILLITCYTGHEGGLEEKEEIRNYLKNLDQKEYNVLKFQFLNQKNNPPLLLGVEKSIMGGNKNGRC